MTPGYHRGELAAQALAGDTQRATHLGRSIRAVVPAVAARFLGERRQIVLGAADASGRMWATMLSGPAGFLDAPDEHTVTVTGHPHPGDPLAALLSGSAQVGTIAIEPATRRRMRVNGRARPTPDGLSITVEQVFSNCPKYIQKRSPEVAGAARPAQQDRRGRTLSAGQQNLIGASDTFFIATADDHGSADASHRGGNPGFVQVLSPTELRWPDYFGNAAYMTLGNLELNPAAGLLFPDWDTGSLLLVTGTARTDWTPDVERTVTFTMEETVELPGAVPLRWSAPEYSPANPPMLGS
jgi:predicted pyridoxine 5'-phosphate oxidase superfamily flavin-nucleotide-binding protein